MKKRQTRYNAKPFLKWAGGKIRLLSHILHRSPKDITHIAEPFLGGGAFIIELLNQYEFEEVIASDLNADLILTFNVVKNNVDELISVLERMDYHYKLYMTWEQRNTFYYAIRDEYNNKTVSDIKIAADFIFLNHTCYNGLYRVNSKGKFNTPHGKYKNPKICDEQNLREVSAIIQNVTFKAVDYHDILNYANSDKWFIYMDPPYKPLTTTASFVNYTSNGFYDPDQEELANTFKKLHDNKVKVLLSNSDLHNVDINNNYFDELYKDFIIDRIPSRHVIGRNSNSRKPLNELLIYNYCLEENDEN